jgi:hypothetical protein
MAGELKQTRARAQRGIHEEARDGAPRINQVRLSGLLGHFPTTKEPGLIGLLNLDLESTAKGG